MKEARCKEARKQDMKEARYEGSKDMKEARYEGSKI